MKRIMDQSPVAGYQLFRYAKQKPDGTTIILPNYYVRHEGKDTCTGTDRLKEAKIAVKKQAGEDAQVRRRRTAKPDPVTVGTLLDLVIEDYKANDQKSLKHARAQIEHGLRPYFGTMLADKVHTDELEQWIAWRSAHRLRKSLQLRNTKLQPASINRELSLLRRAYQLGYERNPQLVEKIPPIKKLAENNVRKGFVTPEQYRKLMEELPAHLKPITCVAFHVANRKGELLNLEWSDVDLHGDPPLITLWPGETKNRDGRTLPILAGEMLDTLRALKAEHDRKWPKQAHVFLNEDDTPLQYHHMRQVWNDACTRANLPGLLFHDLRRSAVRNLRRAGVTQAVARQFSGHKTDSVFNRYNITDFEDLKDAAARLQQFLEKDSRDK
ncbi:MAG TPA: site-specific integrase [Bryobacteraceae bacterium]|jgi:integrase|nr:site-specific integrase [Bryobacteraceae bacterium]